jgi:flagellar motility protein MotE (MotC chaperone)
MRRPCLHKAFCFVLLGLFFGASCVAFGADTHKAKQSTNISKASLLKEERIKLAHEEKVVKVLRQELDLQIRELLKLKEDISGLVIQNKKILANVEEVKKATEELQKKHNPEKVKAKEKERYKKLGEYYSSMRSSKAASILQEMDPNDVVQILLSMDPEAAAAILQRMDPKKAAVVSERMRGGDGDSRQ